MELGEMSEEHIFAQLSSAPPSQATVKETSPVASDGTDFQSASDDDNDNDEGSGDAHIVSSERPAFSRRNASPIEASAHPDPDSHVSNVEERLAAAAASAAAAALEAAARPASYHEGVPSTADGDIVSGFTGADRRIMLERILTEKHGGAILRQMQRRQQEQQERQRFGENNEMEGETPFAPVADVKRPPHRQPPPHHSIALSTDAKMTFRPKVLPLPPEVYGKAAAERLWAMSQDPIHVRTAKWKSHQDQKLQEKGAAARARQREEHPFRPNLQASFASSVPMNKDVGVDTDDKNGRHPQQHDSAVGDHDDDATKAHGVQRGVAGAGAGAGAGGGDDIVVKIDIGNTHGAPPNESTGSKTTTESLQTEKHGAPLPPSDGRSFAADASASKNGSLPTSPSAVPPQHSPVSGRFRRRPATERLFLEASSIKAKREEEAARRQRELEEAEDRECTFTPSVPTLRRHPSRGVVVTQRDPLRHTHSTRSFRRGVVSRNAKHHHPLQPPSNSTVSSASFFPPPSATAKPLQRSFDEPSIIYKQSTSDEEKSRLRPTHLERAEVPLPSSKGGASRHRGGNSGSEAIDYGRAASHVFPHKNKWMVVGQIRASSTGASGTLTRDSWLRKFSEGCDPGRSGSSYPRVGGDTADPPPSFFVPRTNSIDDKSMPAAAKYVEQDVVSRLLRGHLSPGSSNGSSRRGKDSGSPSNSPAIKFGNSMMEAETQVRHRSPPTGSRRSSSGTPNANQVDESFAFRSSYLPPQALEILRNSYRSSGRAANVGRIRPGPFSPLNAPVDRDASSLRGDMSNACGAERQLHEEKKPHPPHAPAIEPLESGAGLPPPPPFVTMQSFQKSLEHSTRKATIAFGGGRDTARTQQIQSNRYMPIADRVRAASSTAAKRAQRGDNKENDGRRRHIAADDAACGNGAHIVAFEDTDDSLLGMAPSPSGEGKGISEGRGNGARPDNMLSPAETMVSVATSGMNTFADGSFVPTRGFHEMMKRQAQHLLKASENKKKKVEALTPSFKPEINERSLQIMEKSGRGTFEQRLAMTLRNREASIAERERQHQVNLGHYDRECFWDASLDETAEAAITSADDDRTVGSDGYTPVSMFIAPSTSAGNVGDYDRRPPVPCANTQARFRPAITAKGLAQRPRSWSEMSVGDAMHREAAVRRIQQRQVEDDERSFTGRPRMTRRAMESGQSRLRVCTDTESYTVRFDNPITLRLYVLFAPPVHFDTN